MNREFLMLAKEYDSSKNNVAGWYMSEKLDGQRAFWDGGISRGLATVAVPWANIDKKVRPIATGLWSRYGNVIQAPEWFLDNLPNILIDGELYMGRGYFQELRSVVSRDIPDERWKQVSYMAFDSPPISSLFESGTINNPNFKLNVVSTDFYAFWAKQGGKHNPMRKPGEAYGFLQEHEQGYITHVQAVLSSVEAIAKVQVVDELFRICALKGEGLMLRHPTATWAPKRFKTLLKVKPMFDSEGVVRGYTAGVGKHEGRLGALTLFWRGKIFNLSGFTDEERDNAEALFPIGSMVTFKFRELSDDGIPKEARYFRKYEPN